MLSFQTILPDTLELLKTILFVPISFLLIIPGFQESEHEKDKVKMDFENLNWKRMSRPKLCHEDDMETGYGNMIPLWQFGLTY